MNRRLARRNIALGVSMVLVIIGLLGVSFAWASLVLAFNH
jgi:hypothetical protein